MTPLIPSDIARCPGDKSHCCKDCARRVQLERDDEKHWYPRMIWVPINGVCLPKISITEYAKETVDAA